MLVLPLSAAKLGIDLPIYYDISRNIIRMISIGNPPKEKNIFIAAIVEYFMRHKELIKH